MTIEIIPAIDISNGKCVRLSQGIKGTEKVYYEEPYNAIKYWIGKGTKRLHVIDLDGAWGSSKNVSLLFRILNHFSQEVKIQVGGGIRNESFAYQLLDSGADRIIIGTLAVKNPELISKISQKAGNEHVMVAIDYRKSKVLIEGWIDEINVNPFNFAKIIIAKGAGSILFSSAEADGMMKGPDIKSIVKMVGIINPVALYAAGGIRNIEDIMKLKKIGVKGIVIGKAFYEERIDDSIFQDFENYD
jgi:phosphoribosylformimino-5-aminoimidazole carboxamide ribotide isomerase